jgi:hypothetical protein
MPLELFYVKILRCLDSCLPWRRREMYCITSLRPEDGGKNALNVNPGKVEAANLGGRERRGPGLSR